MLRIIILLMILSNLVICKMYCSLQKNRENRRSLNVTNGDLIGEKEKANLVFSFARNLLESILRLNLFVVSYLPSHFARMCFYKYICGMNVASKAVIYYGTEIRAPWNITIGKGSIIGDRAILDGRYGIEIGENVNLSTGVCIWTLQHDVQAADFGITNQGKKVLIKNRAWLSNQVVILPGVVIEEGAVAAAGAVVTKNLESNTIYAGVPAKKIGDRNPNLTYVFDGNHMLFL